MLRTLGTHWPILHLFGVTGQLPGYIDKVLSIQTSYLVGYWPCNEVVGESVALDKSSQANDGAYSNVTLGESGIGDWETCGSFNGTSSYLNLIGSGIASDINGQETTISAWIKVSGAGVWTDGAYRTIAIFRVDASNLFGIEKSSTNNRLSFSYIAGGTDKTTTYTPSSGSLGWVHLALVFSKSGDVMKVYINGSQRGTTKTGLGTWAGTVTRAIIGAATTTPANVWNGYIAHPAIWSKALTDAEVAKLSHPRYVLNAYPFTVGTSIIGGNNVIY